MAASANPSGNQDGSCRPSTSAGNPSNGSSGVAVPDSSGPAQALKHDPGLAVEWTAEEQAILEDGMTKYAAESCLVRYAKIAMQLRDKTVRDVALRCRWMTKKGSKKRKDDNNQARKINKKVSIIQLLNYGGCGGKIVVIAELYDKSLSLHLYAAHSFPFKGGSDSSAKATTPMAAQPGVPSYHLPMLPMDNDDDVSFKAIGGTIGQLLEQNAQLFNQISANLASFQIPDNVNLFCQTRDNILTILNDSMKDMPEKMQQMPPLPVKVNEELANSILPRMPM